MPRRAVPCIPPPTSAGAWQCPPCLASVPSVPLCPPHLGTSCGEWPARPSRPPAPPHGACLPPAPSPPLPGARSQPGSIEGQQPPARLPPCLPRLTPLAPAAAPAPPRSARAQRAPGAGCPLLGQRLPQRRGPPLGPGPATCPGERLSGRQRGWGWRAGVERAAGINHFAAGVAAQPGALSPGAGALRCPRRSAKGQRDPRQPRPPEPASAWRRQQLSSGSLRHPCQTCGTNAVRNRACPVTLLSPACHPALRDPRCPAAGRARLAAGLGTETGRTWQVKSCPHSHPRGIHPHRQAPSCPHG